MNLRIISLKGVEYQGEAKSLNIKAKDGEITILPHHRPLITLLKEGTAHILGADDLKKDFPIRGGFLEMNKNGSLNVLID